MRYSLCNHWEFTEQWSDAFCRGEPVDCRPVRLPHTCRELPLHYADPSDYEMVCGYRRALTVPDAPRVFLRFDGAAHQAEIYLNGQPAGQHQGGYTGFTIEITDLVRRGEENLLAVRLDTREDPSLPPFGFVIDYLTYGGLYREVWLETSPQSRVSELFVYTPTLMEAAVQLTVEAPEQAAALRVRLCSSAGETLVCRQLPPAESAECRLTLPDAAPWDTEHPNLYRCIAELLDADGQVLHSRETSFGFRTAVFRTDGFYLNGKKTFLRGLNRHQSYPYIGYAAPESLQRQDARILKNELHCNAVRTSHYPQSQYFLDECDRLGLLVFTELPAGSTSAMGHGRTAPAPCCGRCCCKTAITPALFCGVCASMRAWTMTNSIRAPTKSPTHWTRAGRPLACGIWKRAISWRMFTPTTISPIMAQTPGPSGKRM